jgi:hypothetical protein
MANDINDQEMWSICARIAQMDSTQLRRVASQLKMTMDDQARSAAWKMRVGAMVSWKSKDGLTYRGTVERVMAKNVHVKTDGPVPQRWKVTASLLQVES